MRKVLFIAYDYPPCPTLGGAIRSAKFVKYLRQFGWNPLVVTLRHHQRQYTSDPDYIVRLRSLTPINWPYQVTPYGWTLRLFFGLKRLIKETSPDVIYISCPPFMPLVAVSWFKRHTNIPLVVDFRDAWSLDPYQDGSNLKKLAQRYFFPWLERKCLALADFFIANTPTMQNEYLGKYDFLSARNALIPNGFDEDDFKDKTSPKKESVCTFLYCGRLGAANRAPSLLLNAFQGVIAAGYSAILKIVGTSKVVLQEEINSLKIAPHLEVLDSVSYEEAINHMFLADILIVYQGPSSSIVTPIAGKTYEYLRAGKPILVIAPYGDNIELVKSYCATHELITSFQSEDVTLGMIKLLQQCGSNKAAGSLMTDANYARDYNRRELTRRLAALFDRVKNETSC